MIRLTPFQPAAGALSRPHLFPGRAMGERAFEQLQAYADARLAPLLAGRPAGILHGLELDLKPPAADTPAGEGLRVRSGLAVAANGRALGLFGPLRDTWAALVQRWLRDTGAADAAGVYQLVLRRRYLPYDAEPGIDPCRRTELDPTRDLRSVAVGSLALRRLAVSDAARADLAPATLQNRLVAGQLDGAFLDALGHAVLLALLALESLPASEVDAGAADPAPDAGDLRLADLGLRLAWVSVAAARRPALPDAGHRVLLAQTRDALFTARDAAIAAGTPVGEHLEAALRLDVLPAAGELPLALLEDAAARPPARPRLRWLPAQLGVDMVPVPEATVADLIRRHLPGDPLDLRRPAGQRLRLLLAVSAADYRPDLLDLPAIDARLADDLHRHHRRAHTAWHDWHREHDRLYHLLEAEDIDLSAAEIRALDLPEPEPAPELPATFYDRVKAERRAAIAAAHTGAGDPDLYPYDTPNPPPPQGWADWLAAHDGAPPAPPTPAANGLVVQYRIAQVEMERTDNRIRALRGRLEKTRDYVLLQRQQLDSQTVSLASLAGGVAGDGAGLQVARWLPFTELLGAQPPAAPQPTPAEPPDATPAGGSGTESEPVIAAAAPQTVTASFSGVTATPIGTFALAQPAVLTETFQPANVFSGVDLGGVEPGGIRAAAAAPRFTGGARPMPTGALRSGVLGIPAGSRLRDARASTVELGLKFDRLNRVKATPRRAITEPAFEGQTYHFGAIDHIRPEVTAYAQAHRGMADLLDTLPSLFEASEATQIRGDLEDLGDLTDPASLPDLPAAASIADTGVLNGVQARYQALFAAGQLLTRRIALMEGRYNAIEAELTAALRERIGQETRLEKLAGQIEASRQRLDGLDRRRAERLGDYGVAQALSSEDFAAVRSAHLSRTEVLTRRLTGLFYVRERAAPVTQPLADPLSLRHADPGDPVPGCDWDTDVTLDDALTPFFEAVLEVPMDAWALLRPLRQHLPPPVRLDYLHGLRAERFKQRRRHRILPVQSTRLAGHLAPLVTANQSILGAFGGRPVPRPGGSLAGFNQANAEVLSLADLLGGTGGGLQRRAQQLHNRLEQCMDCLLERLRRVQPSLRLRWAQLAEDDRLDVTAPGRWPGLADAEAADFDNTRTIAELVDWWYRQLADNPDAEARAALGDMLRAVIIVAARADPAEILRGRVAVPPRRLAVGERLRVQLNRPAAAGARLQLLDDARRVVGLLRVQDQDEQGAVADIVQVEAALQTQTVTTRFAVLASAAVAKLG